MTFVAVLILWFAFIAGPKEPWSIVQLAFFQLPLAVILELSVQFNHILLHLGLCEVLLVFDTVPVLLFGLSGGLLRPQPFLFKLMKLLVASLLDLMAEVIVSLGLNDP